MMMFVLLFHSAWGSTAPRSQPLCVNKLHVHIFKRQISKGISMDMWVLQQKTGADDMLLSLLSSSPTARVSVCAQASVSRAHTIALDEYVSLSALHD